MDQRLRALLKLKAENKHGLTGMDVIRLGKNFGYMIRGLQRLDEDKWIDAGHSVIDHHFDIHDKCGPWCRRKDQSDQQRVTSDRFYRDIDKDNKLYKAVSDLLARFITLDKLREVAHPYDTQVNESLNNTISWLAPKNKCYGGSCSLTNRICIAIGVNTLGMEKYFARLFKALAIPMTPNVAHFLGIKEVNWKKRIDKCKSKETKKLRNKNIFNKLRKEEASKQKERRKNDAAQYRTGMNMEEGDNNHPTGPPCPKKPRRDYKNAVCGSCGQKGHCTSRSRVCVNYSGKQNSITAATTNTSTTLPTTATTNVPNNDAADDVDDYDGIPLQLPEADYNPDADSDDEVRQVDYI
jgi:hypothetical protein